MKDEGVHRNKQTKGLGDGKTDFHQMGDIVYLDKAGISP